MSFTPIKDTINKSPNKSSDNSEDSKGSKLTAQQIESGDAITAAEKAFIDVFGEELSAHAKPLYLKNRTMTVTCTSSVLAQEIRLNQAKIVAKINKYLGGKEVDRIRYLS
jgi:hypothetical protein